MMSPRLTSWLLVLGLLAVALPARAADVSFPEVAAPPPPPPGQPAGEFDQPGRFGVGLAVDDFVSGASVKAYLSGAWAVQGTIGFGYVWATGFMLNADVLYEMPRFVSNPQLSMNWYLGAGGTFGVASCGELCSGSTYGGAQFVAGVALQLHHFPVEAVVEARPTIVDVPVSGGYGVRYGWWGLGLAARYFFK